MRCLLLLPLFATLVAGAEPSLVERLWPGPAPGDPENLPAEADTTTERDPLIAHRRVARIGNVSVPTISVFRPQPGKGTGAAVVVCPGGGYYILAMDLEGTEVCEWLQSAGITAVLLKYRVPSHPTSGRQAAPLQDAQRAMGLVRSRAGEWGLDPRRIGVLGFSAGAHLAARLGSEHEARTYPRVDAFDDASCRPDFAILVYPAHLAVRGQDRLPDAVRVEAGHTPPTFITMAQDDGLGVANATAYYLALQKAGVPASLHLYPRGGHGYGLRRTANAATTWPDRVEEWMRESGWLGSRR